MTKNYEELLGGFGRIVFFRPERIRLRSLAAAEALQLLIDGSERSLFDISMNGLSFILGSRDELWPMGSDCTVALLIQGRRFFSGRARVVRHQALGPSLLVGLELNDGFVDVRKLVDELEDHSMEQELFGIGAAQGRAAVPESYRGVAEELALLLAYYKKVLTEAEERYRQRAENVEERLHELREKAYEAMAPRWRSLSVRAAQVVREFESDRAAVRACQAYTERMLVPLLIEAPVARQAITKPLGYPGDYRVLDYYLTPGYHGDSVFGQVLHRLACTELLPEGLRRTWDYLADVIGSELSRHSDSDEQRTFRALSVGAGSAPELSKFLDRGVAWRGAASWTLVDQELGALSEAYRRAFERLSVHRSDGSVECLHLDFIKIINGVSLVPDDQGQDLIYCTGLFNYLNEERAQPLLASLYERLVPGGLLVVVAIASPNDDAWMPELAGSWGMVYRERKQMEALVPVLPEQAQVEFVEGYAASFHYLRVRKPSA